MKLRIFTDGACSGNPGPGGWAIVVNFKNRNAIESGYEFITTNNRMEIRAVIEALNVIDRMLWDRSAAEYDSYEIHSDSAYVVNAVSKGWVRKWRSSGWKKDDGDAVKNVDLWDELLSSLDSIEYDAYPGIVSFVKVKGHDGNVFNEMADEAARKEILKNKGAEKK